MKNKVALNFVCRLTLAVLFIANDLRLALIIHEEESLPAAAIVTIYVLSSLSMLILFMNRNKVIRTITEIFIFTTLFTDFLYIVLAGYPFSFPDAINLFNNPGYASGALASFKFTFCLALILTIFAFTALKVSFGTVRLSFSGRWTVPAIIIYFVLCSYSIVHPGTLDSMPSVYRVTGNLLTANLDRPETKWRRKPVAVDPGPVLAKKIIFIVDESISGSALTINGSALQTTPYLLSQADKYLNFGVASSFTNYSAGSNHMLISGTRMKDLPDTGYSSYASPGIFQFAKKAGYTTFLFDAQSAGRGMQNYIAPPDLAFIDSVYRPRLEFPLLRSSSMDSVIAEKVASVINDTGLNFVYIIKNGAHWPYAENFPANFDLPRTASIKPSATDYMKSVVWNVDNFWKLLLPTLTSSRNLLMLYTSDHGEDYTSASYRMRHASLYQPSVIEGLVPLLAVDRCKLFPDEFRPNGKYSHEYIFPTLIYAMGYNRSFVKTNFGETLLDKPRSEPRWFLTGDVFGRGKNKRFVIDTDQAGL